MNYNKIIYLYHIYCGPVPGLVSEREEVLTCNFWIPISWQGYWVFGIWDLQTISLEQGFPTTYSARQWKPNWKSYCGPIPGQLSKRGKVLTCNFWIPIYLDMFFEINSFAPFCALVCDSCEWRFSNVSKKRIFSNETLAVVGKEIFWTRNSCRGTHWAHFEFIKRLEPKPTA